MQLALIFGRFYNALMNEFTHPLNNFDNMPGHTLLINKDIILVHAVRFTLGVVFYVQIQQISSATFFRLQW